MDEEIIQTEEYIEDDDEELKIYPRFSIDEHGNPIRDARYYPFISRVISSANKAIAADYKYSHFE